MTNDTYNGVTGSMLVVVGRLGDNGEGGGGSRNRIAYYISFERMTRGGRVRGGSSMW